MRNANRVGTGRLLGLKAQKRKRGKMGNLVRVCTLFKIQNEKSNSEEGKRRPNPCHMMGEWACLK